MAVARLDGALFAETVHGAAADATLQVANVVLNTVVGLVPLLGDYLDFLFKANLRNLKMLEVCPAARSYDVQPRLSLYHPSGLAPHGALRPALLDPPHARDQGPALHPACAQARPVRLVEVELKADG